MPKFTLWVEALSSVRGRADRGGHGPMRYRVRGLPAEHQISIVKDQAGGRWQIERGTGEELQGDYETPNAALADLQAEFDAQSPD
jgi:hypothetical protein